MKPHGSHLQFCWRFSVSEEYWLQMKSESRFLEVLISKTKSFECHSFDHISKKEKNRRQNSFGSVNHRLVI